MKRNMVTRNRETYPMCKSIGAGLLFLAVLAIGASVDAEELCVAKLSCDRVVLQREIEVPVWGRGEANTDAVVNLRDEK